jgi:hypothetical protein
VALLKRRLALPWLRDIVDGDKKVDCQRLLDEVGKEVGTKERSGGDWGGMNSSQTPIWIALNWK